MSFLEQFVGLFFGACFFLMYFYPTFKAYQRRSVHFYLIMFVNLLLGWTIVGWIAAFVLADLSRQHPANIPPAKPRHNP